MKNMFRAMRVVLLVGISAVAHGDSFTAYLNQDIEQEADNVETRKEGKKKREDKRSDKKSARRVANYVVSKECVEDIHTFVKRSSGPLKEYIRNYFFHCDFHKEQLLTMKKCFSELETLLEESTPICVHALFSYVVSEAMTRHVQSTAINALNAHRSMAVYAAPAIMDHIKGQDGVLNIQETELLNDLNQRWSDWYQRWSGFLGGLLPYIEARTELRETFLDKDKKSLMFSMILKHALPGLWFVASNFRIARIMFGSSVVKDSNYFLKQLILNLHKNVTVQRAVLEEKVIESLQETLDVYGDIFHDAIDERLAYL